MGLDSPLATPVAFLAALALLAAALLHVKNLRGWVDEKTERRLTGLRLLGAILVGVLLLRPYWSEETPGSGLFRVVALADLSGSMLTRDERGGPSRIDNVRKAFEERDDDAWISKVRESFDRVETMGFEVQVEALRPASWERPAEGRKTALGDALMDTLASHGPEDPLGSVVAFSDGRNNQGARLLDVAKDFLERGIPVNVVGVGEFRAGGDIQVRFPDRRMKAVAKEAFELKAVVRNEYERAMSGKAVLWQGDERLGEASFDASPGGEAEVRFPPITPEERGLTTYRVTVETPDGDSDSSNDVDSTVVEVLPPAVANVLYLSNRMTQNYRFIKAALTSDERFAFHSLIRMGEEQFHAFGEDMPTEYPEDPKFWLTFEAVLLDAEVLEDLSEQNVKELRRFVDKRGGGMLVLGDARKARAKLGGLVPAREVETVISKENRRVVVIEEPVFAPEDEVDGMKVFLPSRLPALVARRSNPAAVSAVVTRSGGMPTLVLQAYGAGRSAYWGTMHDWRWPLAGERGPKDFRKFWLALTDWLASGGEERVRTEVGDRPLPLSSPVDLSVDVLGSDFEPSQDALVEARVKGPDGEEKIVHLYPEGSESGRYAGSFRAPSQGEYKVTYAISMPDDEQLEEEAYLRVSDRGEESSDVGFAERDLQALSRITGGNYHHYRDLDDAVDLRLAADLPTRTLRHHPTESWLFFLVLFFVAGLEWIIRRQAGLR